MRHPYAISDKEGHSPPIYFWLPAMLFLGAIALKGLILLFLIF